MITKLQKAKTNQLAARHRELLNRNAEQAINAKSIGTRRAYKSDWNDFCIWCRYMDCTSLPAEPVTVALYLTHLSDALQPSTIARRVAAIRYAHRLAGFEESPTENQRVKDTLAGIRRDLKNNLPKQKYAITVTPLQRMINALQTNSIDDIRDRALILIGFAGAFRRSALVALQMEHIAFKSEGVEITIKRDKTDQENKGHLIGVPYNTRNPTMCPVRALQAWVDAAKITEGPVFRRLWKGGRVSNRQLSDQSVALIIKSAMQRAGFADKEIEHYAGHSLRSGFATAAAEAGASDREIMEQTGHRDPKSLNAYIRRGNLFKRNPLNKLDY